MLDFYLDDTDDARFSVIIVVIISTENKIINCDICDQEAVIFQDEGNFCLSCWQDRTEPNVS
jgi:hypothetical protein